MEREREGERERERESERERERDGERVGELRKESSTADTITLFELFCKEIKNVKE